MKSKPARVLLASFFIYLIVNRFLNIQQGASAPMSPFLSGIAVFIILISAYYFFNTIKKATYGRFDFKEEWAEILFWSSMSIYWLLRLLDSY